MTITTKQPIKVYIAELSGADESAVKYSGHRQKVALACLIKEVDIDEVEEVS